MAMGAARRSGLPVCGLISVLAHAALLGWGGQPGAAARRVDPAMKARSIQLAAPRLASLQVPEEAVAEPLVLADHSDEVTHMASLQPLSPLRAPLPEALAASPEGPQFLDAPVLPAGRPELFNDDGYVPRPKLSVVPVAQQPLVLEWPAEGAPPAGRYHGVVSLYIDEQGVIQHIRFDDDGLPESLREQARSALATLRYSPGKVKDQIVKSRIRLELNFEADPRVVTRGSRR